jgi:hypothetical protein
MAMVGSAMTLDIAIELMEREQVSNEDIMNLISGFSMFQRDPSDYVLGQLLVRDSILCSVSPFSIIIFQV